MRKVLLINCIIVLFSLPFTYSQTTDSLLTASDFGASNSISFGVLGHDAISSFYRFYLNDKSMLMTGIGVQMLESDGFFAVRANLTLSVGGTYYLRKKLTQKKNRIKVKHHGIYLLGGYSFGGKLEPFGSLSMPYMSIGYNYERFFRNKTNRSYSFLAGPSLSMLPSKSDLDFNLFGERTKVMPGIFVKFQYNLFFKNKK